SLCEHSTCKKPRGRRGGACLCLPAVAGGCRIGQQQLKLARCPHSLAPTLVALPSISAIPFLDSWIPGLKAWPLLSLPAVAGIRCRPIRFFWSPESEIR